ncbi:peroxisomal copper amine oxidase, variant 2 [Pleurotus ostreatus]|nr:peroxisomal copper amine oxidase, variant 2 [Pleurotus ostreatus]
MLNPPATVGFISDRFYDDGYKDGFDHGRIHGLIEGRALGREKGFEMWEELGFYEGFAVLWKMICARRVGDSNERIMNHINQLLQLISQFPRVNPSLTSSSADVDIPKLFRQIRSRYKILCSTLGVKPSLRSADGAPSEEDFQEDSNPSTRQPVWKVDEQSRVATGQSLEF